MSHISALAPSGDGNRNRRWSATIEGKPRTTDLEWPRDPRGPPMLVNSVIDREPVRHNNTTTITVHWMYAHRLSSNVTSAKPISLSQTQKWPRKPAAGVLTRALSPLLSSTVASCAHPPQITRPRPLITVRLERPLNSTLECPHAMDPFTLHSVPLLAKRLAVFPN